MAKRLKNTGKTVFVCPSVAGGKLVEATLFEDKRTGVQYAYRVPKGATVDLFVLIHNEEKAKVVNAMAQKRNITQVAVPA